MRLIRTNVLKGVLFLAWLLSSACSHAQEARLEPVPGIHFSETYNMKDVSGKCSLAIYRAIANYNTYMESKNKKSILGTDIFVKGALCDLSGKDGARRFVALLISSDLEGNNLLADGQVITYFDENINIIEWGL